MKKILAMTMALALCLSLFAGCSSGGSAESGSSSSASSKSSSSAESSGGSSGGLDTLKKDAASHFDSSGKIITPVTSQPVTYTMLLRKNSLDVGKIEDKQKAVWDKSDLCGVKFNIQEVDQPAWSEKMNIIFASDDLPDCIWGPIQNLVNYTDQVLDITDYVQNYMPTVWDFIHKEPLYYAGESIGGRMYSLSNIRQNPNEAHLFVMGINHDWLKAVNKEVPTTLDELTDVLRAFVKGDPNGNGKADEIGLGFQGGYCDGDQNSATLDFVRVFFGLICDGQNYSEDDIMVENKKVLYAPQDTRYYDMLKWLHSCYAEGLIDKDGFNQTNADFKQKGNDNRYGFAMGGCYITDSVGVKNGPSFDYLIPVKDSKGKITIPITQAPADFQRHIFTLKKNCKNPENLLMFWEYVNESVDRCSDIWYGAQGKLELDPATKRQAKNTTVGWWWKDDNGVKRRESNQDYYPTDAGYQNYSSWRNSHTQEASPTILDTAWDENRILSKSIQYQYARDKIYTPYYYPEMFPYGEMSYENTSRRAEIKTELFKYVENFFADSVINGVDDAKWQKHLEALKQLNVDEFLKLYQEEYDYLSKLQ